MRRRTLGLELTGKRLVVVEVDPATDPPAILQAVTAELSATGLGETLTGLLAQHRIGSRESHVVLAPSTSAHRTLLLPPMSASERRLFLERELGRELGAGLLVDSQPLRTVEGPPRKEEVFTVAVPGAETEQALAGVMAARLSPRLVTTIPLALTRAAEALAPESADRPTAMAHWGFQGLTLVVVDGGAPRFTREIPHLAAPGIDPRDWFVTEFQRSIRQYTQTVKGATVGSLLIGSVDARFEAQLEDVAARLGMPVVNLNQTLRDLLPEGPDDGTPAGVFLPAFGAALAGQGALNLLPPSILARRRVALLKRGAAAAAALLVLSLSYSTWGAMQEAATYRKAVAELAAKKRARDAQIAQVQQIKQERDHQYERIRLLTGDPLGGPPLADVFKEISRFAPDELRLERLVVGREAGLVKIRVTGWLESVDLARAQSEFNRFYFGLQESPFFSDVIFNPPAVSKVTIQQGSGPYGLPEGRTLSDIRARDEAQRQKDTFGAAGKKLTFELELRLRPVK